MITWGAHTYGDESAADYDERFTGVDDIELITDALSDLAREQPVLELGSGTGRLAIPLSERGLNVTGMDASQKMIDLMTAKAGAESVETILGDFSTFDLDGRRFGLVFVSCNTLMCLPTQDQQISCFQSVSRHLFDDGAFVVEMCLPKVFTGRPSVVVSGAKADSVTLDTLSHDSATQQVFRQRITIGGQGISLHPVRYRYVWPSELDLMARLGGLRLAERWGGWERRPFDSRDRGYVSVYRRH